MKNISKIFEIENGVDIMETPSAMTAICEYIIMNGVKSDWETVYAAMLGLAFGNVPMIEGVTSTCSELDYGYRQIDGYFVPDGKPGFGITFKTR